LFPANHGNSERRMTRNIYPSFEKPNTRYARNMEGPTFILVTHFTSKIKLIKFLNERGKISSLRFEGRITTDVKEGARMI